MRRLFILFIALAVLFLIPFVIWGDAMDWNQESAARLLQDFGNWAWLVALVALAADLALPIPATAVMAALGFLYGPWMGALLGTIGFSSSALIAYWLCATWGRPAALRFVGEKDLEEGKRLFDAMGGWLIVVSRWLPLFPETISCMAGLIRMPWSRFALAVVCGSLPISLVFAWIGHSGAERPLTAILASALAPPALWAVVQIAILRKKRRLGIQSDSRDRGDDSRRNG